MQLFLSGYVFKILQNSGSNRIYLDIILDPNDWVNVNLFRVLFISTYLPLEDKIIITSMSEPLTETRSVSHQRELNMRPHPTRRFIITHAT